MPDSGTIVACRGRVDFYLWKGVPVARSWPRKSTQPRTAGEVAQSQKFTAAAKWTTNVSTAVEGAYKEMMVGTGVTWVDFQRAMFLGNSWIVVKP